MFSFRKWWKIPLVLLALPFHLIMWVVDRLERLSWDLAASLSNRLPRFRVRIRRNSRLGKFLVDATESYYPTLCEGFWGTVARPFKARVMRWVYLLGGVMLAVAVILVVILAVYSGIRDHGVRNTALWAGIIIGVFIVAEIILLLVVGTARFAAEYLCPVKFEIMDNGPGHGHTP